VQAILSDIHSNIHALDAVLADMQKHEVSEVICLGDVIGYGPNPLQCIDRAMEFDVVLQGNHEQALMVQMEGAAFNMKARGSIDWTREQLNMLSDEREQNARRWDFLGDLVERYETEEALYVHGTPRDPVCEYLRPRDVYNRHKMEDLFARIDHLCFVGHTHVSGVWTEEMVFQTSSEVNFRYDVPESKTFVNPGSVGQPRDGDVRASYLLFDGAEVIWRRVPYSIEKTAQRIRGIEELDPFLAERLLEGR
jgi:diadenosine tetraphosphatase ApaH/serine/threonine PP2A family protein phosphatase